MCLHAHTHMNFRPNNYNHLSPQYFTSLERLKVEVESSVIFNFQNLLVTIPTKLNRPGQVQYHTETQHCNRSQPV